MADVILQKDKTPQQGQFKQQTQQTIPVIKPKDKNRIVTSLLQNKVFIYSAIVLNLTENQTNWDIVLNGWEHKTLEAVNLICCIMYDNDITETVSQSISIKRRWDYGKIVTLRVIQWVCPNVKHTLPVSVTLMKDNDTCPGNADVYVNVEPVYKLQSGTLGVCGKLVYDNIDASNMIEWFEFQRLMRVDKILLYEYNLNVNAKKVLEYYSKIGFVEVRDFEQGGSVEIPRALGDKKIQVWSDKQVTVLDCQTRLSGATYIALYDLDEFIYPFKTTDYKQMLRNLTSGFPNAAGFTFKTQIYIKDWNQTNYIANSSLAMVKYTKRTDTMRDRVKNFIIVDRLEPGRMSTHGYETDQNFVKPVVSPSIAVIKHFRSCRKEWLRFDGKKCFRTFTRIQDNSMLKMARTLEPEVLRVKQTLGLTT